MRLCAQNGGWKNREQFLGVAAHLMRRILVDHARARGAAKRKRGLRVTLADHLAAAPSREPDLVELDEALDELASRDQRQGRLVELRFFGGLTQQEAADLLGISLATASRDWAFAKAWLFRRLTTPTADPPR